MTDTQSTQLMKARRDADVLAFKAMSIADRVVPKYRQTGGSHSCTSHTAQRWNDAYEAARIALGETHD